MTGSGPWNHLSPWPRNRAPPRRLRLEPDAVVRTAIAAHLGLETISRLSADLELRPRFDGVEVVGRLTATVTRLCGITLEPFEESIDEPIALRALPEGSPHIAKAPTGDIVVDIESDDPDEVHGRDGLDLGAFLVESLGLALDPYPRKPDAVFDPPAGGDPISPFGILAGLATPKVPER
jgi:hypothetical protein